MRVYNPSVIEELILMFTPSNPHLFCTQIQWNMTGSEALDLGRGKKSVRFRLKKSTNPRLFTKQQLLDHEARWGNGWGAVLPATVLATGEADVLVPLGLVPQRRIVKRNNYEVRSATHYEEIIYLYRAIIAFKVKTVPSQSGGWSRWGGLLALKNLKIYRFSNKI